MQRLLLIIPVFSLVLAQPDILLTKTIIGSGRIHNGFIANSIHRENLFQGKIMTYNILYYDDEERESYYQTIIYEIKPDILVCQEVMNTTGYNHFLDAVFNSAIPANLLPVADMNADGSDNIDDIGPLIALIMGY
mgnify:CR=1 FL=1